MDSCQSTGRIFEIEEVPDSASTSSVHHHEITDALAPKILLLHFSRQRWQNKVPKDLGWRAEGLVPVPR